MTSFCFQIPINFYPAPSVPAFIRGRGAPVRCATDAPSEEQGGVLELPIQTYSTISVPPSKPGFPHEH